MLEEETFELNRDVIKTARPAPIKARKSKDLNVISILDSSRVWTHGGIVVVSNFEDFLKILIGYNTVAAGYVTDFHSMLARLIDYKTLFKTRQLYCGDYIFYLMDRFGRFFSIRKGNEWGSLYIVDEKVDAITLLERSQELLTKFRLTGWNIDRIMPPARLAENLFRQHVNRALLPNFSAGDIDDIHIKRSVNCFRGGRMEAAKLGCFEDIYDFDFNSSHFSILRELPAIGEVFVDWIDSNKYQKNAILGYCRVRMHTDKNCKIGITATRLSYKGKHRLFYNTGETIGWRTKGELDLIARSGYGDFDILEGSWAIPKREIVKPFMGVSRVLEKIMQDETIRADAKMIAATSWGKFANSTGGPLWNPFYASEVSANARVKITELAMSVADNLIALTIDGLVLTEPLPDSVLSTEPIGGMKMQKYDFLLSLSDFYRCSTIDPDNWNVLNDGIMIQPAYVTLPYIMEFGGNAADIGRKLSGAKVPFGSTKRICPKHLTLSDLERHQYALNPPTPEETLELFFSTKEMAPSGF